MKKSNNPEAKRIKHWKEIVDKIVSVYNKFDSACSASINAGSMDVNGPLYDSIWRGFAVMLNMVDCQGWIHWYIYENECGKKKFTAASVKDKKLKKITTSKELAELIVESEKHSAK